MNSYQALIKQTLKKLYTGQWQTWAMVFVVLFGCGVFLRVLLAFLPINSDQTISNNWKRSGQLSSGVSISSPTPPLATPQLELAVPPKHSLPTPEPAPEQTPEEELVKPESQPEQPVLPIRPMEKLLEKLERTETSILTKPANPEKQNSSDLSNLTLDYPLEYQMESQSELTNPSDQPKTVSTAEITQDYVVKQGDSLWRLAEQWFGNGYEYVQIAKANQLPSNSRLEIGQVLKRPTGESITPQAWSTEESRDGEEVASIPSISSSDVLIEKMTLPPSTIFSAESTPETTQLAATDTRYEVKPGDSLWKIASSQLGSGFRWPEIYRLNRAVIGDNPGLIYPRASLLLPPSHPQEINSSPEK